MIYTRFEEIPPLSFDVILADPPTDFETYSDLGHGKSQHAHYDVMTWEELNALDVAQYGRGDAILFLWACWPTLDRSLAMLKAWNFKYITGGSWHKRTKHGKSGFGTGYRFRSATEPYLLGTLGNPKTVKDIRNVIDAEGFDEIDALNLGHSRKPDEQYAICERIMPRALRYLEMFSRKTRPGWDQFGNEVGKFDEVAA